MPKTCQHNECTYRVFGGGYCKSHQYLRPDLKASQLKRTPVKKQSDKEYARQQAYRKVKNELFKEERFCEAELPDCLYWADQVHHKRGRIGDLLTDKRFFLLVCGNCHRKIEDSPEMAKALNLSVSRLNKAS